MKFIVLMLALSSFASAQSVNQTVSKWKGDVDGLDMWEIANTREAREAAVEAFETKCAIEIPHRTNTNILKLGYQPTDFYLRTTVTKYFISGWGESYRCTLEATANDQANVAFSKPFESKRYFDIFEPNTNQIKLSSIDQCKVFMKELEAKGEEIKLFSRNALLEWVKLPGSRKEVEACFVRYTLLAPR